VLAGLSEVGHGDAIDRGIGCLILRDDLRSVVDHRLAQVMLGLEIEPELGAVAEVAGEAKGCVGGDAAFFGEDFADAGLGDADVFAEAIGSDL
jgi:hypothetical protein